MKPTSISRWAVEEFGGLAHHAGTARRWVQMAAAAARRPAGTVPAVFSSDAARKAAYRQLERTTLRPQQVREGPARASAHRAAAHPFAYVPVDSTSLTLTDRPRSKGTGPLGARKFPTRGRLFMTALAVSPQRVPLGLADQLSWRRTERVARKRHNQRPFQRRESRYFLTLCRRIHARWRAMGVTARPWFQVDRGGDMHPLLRWAVAHQVWLTVRAMHNRRVIDPLGSKLWEAMGRRLPLTFVSVWLPATETRAARQATLMVRAARVRIEAKEWSGSWTAQFPMGAVLVQEVGTVPADEEGVEWMLLTTHPLDTVEDAVAVVRGYTARWSIEEFHKTWKSGLCAVEDTQLRSAEAIDKWATLLAAVAVRSEHLKSLSRAEPELAASAEFSPEEIESIVLLREPKAAELKEPLTLAKVVRWIADLGGYTGKSSGGPPGQKVIARGLAQVLPAAQALRNLRKRDSAKKR
jgi:hypothetical protein